MQSPLAALMGTAGGAVDLMNRTTNHDSPKAGFDDQLKSALAGAPGFDGSIADKPVHEKAKAAKGATDDDMTALLENPQAVQVLQYLFALQSMGVNNADAQALLSGKSEISDDGLKGILAAMGIKGTDIAQIMTDPKLVSGLKTQLAQTVSMKVQIGTNPLLQGKGAEISDEELDAIQVACGKNAVLQAKGMEISDEELDAIQVAAGTDAVLQNKGADIADTALKAIPVTAGAKDTDSKQPMADRTPLAGLKTNLASAVSAGDNPGAGSHLQGAGSEISDDDVKAILAAQGLTDADITRVMADPKVVSGLKAKLAEIRSLQPIELQAGDVPDAGNMIEQAQAGQETSDAIKARVVMPKGIPTGNTKEISQASTEIKASVAEFLRTSEIKPLSKGTPIFTEMLEAQSAQSSQVQASEGSMPEVLQAVDVLEKTLNIPKKTLQDLFFSSDPQVRQAALDDSVSEITEFLKANSGKDLSKQVTGALGMLKGALTKDEFVKIEDTFKAFNQDPALIAPGIGFDKHDVQSLAKTLGNETGMARGNYTQEVIDQIKQALPAGLKALEGSMTLKLNPPMLGRVDVEVSMQDGQIMASFKADQPITRDILQQNMHILKDTLADQGIKAAQFVVTTDTFNSRDHQGNPLAWAGYEPGKNGSSSRQGNRQDPGNPGRGEDYLDGTAPVQGYSEQGGLDIFA